MSIKGRHHRIQGYSLASLSMGVFILSVALAATMKLFSYVATSNSRTNNDELLNQTTRLTEMFASRVSRGGAYFKDTDAAKGIQLCALNTSGTSCNRYTNQTNNFCMALSTQVGNGEPAYLTMKAFRLLNGQLQERSIKEIDLATFDIKAFCKNNNSWENLHNDDDFLISSIRLCRFKADSFSTITADYSQNCTSVITPTALTSAYWIALFTVTPKAMGSSSLQQSRIIQLFNDTIVSTP